MLFRDGKPAPARGPAHSVDVVIKADAPEITRPAESAQASCRRSQASERPTFRLVLRPEPRTDGERALRALLKAALRRYGLKCLSVEKVPPRQVAP